MQGKVVYPKGFLIMARLLAFLTALESMRGITYKFNKDECIENLNMMLGCDVKEMFHHDTLNNFLEELPWEELHKLRLKIVKKLLRSKYFEQYRLKDKYWLVAFDGTGILTFNKRHCKHCLKREYKNKETGEVEKTIYYHPVLEAKLIVGDIVISIATEFIENLEENPTKQDSELKAFYRLAEQLKKDFPRLPICMLGDSLFACEPVFKVCEKNNWKYIINFKEGSIPTIAKEFETLKTLDTKKHKTIRFADKKVTQEYNWVNEISYMERKLNVFECMETVEKTSKKTRFVWITNFNVTDKNVEELSNYGGRKRWKIENEGFNEQKNGVYHLEHSYSKDYNAAKNHYLLLQIAHIIGQLMEHGSLLKDKIKRYYGSFKNFCLKLLEDFRCKVVTEFELNEILSERIQIKFSSG